MVITTDIKLYSRDIRKPQQYISLNLVFIQQIISGRVGSVEGGIIER